MLIATTTAESTVRLRSSIDLVGAFLLSSGIAGVLIAVSFGPAWGWGSGSTLAFLVGGLVLLGAWLLSARHIREPLLDPELLRQRPVFLTSLGAGLAYGTTSLFTLLLPMLAMTPIVLRLGYGFGVDAKGFALFQAPLGGMLVVGGIVVGMLVSRGVRPRLLMVTGALLMAFAAAGVAFVPDVKLLIGVFAGIFGTGMGMSYAAIPNLLIEAVPPQMLASTAGVVGVLQAILSAVLPVIAFAAMNNSHIAPIPAELTQGAVFYTSQGFQVAFLIAAAAEALAALVVFGLPRRIDQVAAPAAGVERDVPVLVAD
ncbi:MFS transporter [Rhodococcus chondri]|uniref:MFS transporter n=1 Tax=Rhodococcus chondri TaxID=3065941 RepID=UPI002E7BB6D4|nr:MFS transporter [Rhodococcus sp. CC-R104]